MAKTMASLRAIPKPLQAFFRGMPIAGLQALGVLAVVHHNLLGVCAASFAINYVWFANVRAVTDGHRGWFAAGAACGQVLTVWLVS